MEIYSARATEIMSMNNHMLINYSFLSEDSLRENVNPKIYQQIPTVLRVRQRYLRCAFTILLLISYT